MNTIELKELTPAEKRVLIAALKYFVSNDNFPSQRWIADELEIWQNAVKQILFQLERKGWIEKSDDERRYRRTEAARQLGESFIHDSNYT